MSRSRQVNWLALLQIRAMSLMLLCIVISSLLRLACLIAALGRLIRYYSGISLFAFSNSMAIPWELDAINNCDKKYKRLLYFGCVNSRRRAIKIALDPLY